MKKVLLAVGAFAAMHSVAVAGGDIAPVEPAVAVPVVADENENEGIYIGLAYSYMSHDIDYAGLGTRAEMDFNGVILELGYQFNEYVSVEGRYATTIGDDIDDIASSSEATGWGLFVKPMLPLSERATVYGLLGYSKTDTSNTLDITGVDFDEDGLSWGGGFALDMNEDFTVFGEYVRWYDDTVGGYDHVVDGFSLGVTYQF